uniref:Uncharacterized protein n=1 Tax=Panagrolaimus sp. PS1159 TaxID=55785 RepID=A0AC35F0X5_9BILA
MVVGSYLIKSTHMHIKDEKGIHFIRLPNGPPLIEGHLTPSKLKERIELVFQLQNKKMKNLIIVNSSLNYFETIQACVEIAEKYADNVMVIPPLLALLTYAFEDLSKFQNPPPKEIILVITITSKFVDFVILRRDQNFQLYVAEFQHIEDLNQCKAMFSKIYNRFDPHSTIFVVHESMLNLANEIKYQFKPENCFFKRFKKWDFVLMLGALFRAMDDDGFDTRYHIANFSSGFETTTRNNKRQILLPERSPLPCNIHGFNGIGQIINIFYSPQYYQMYDDLICLKRTAIKHTINASGQSNEALGYVDERGVPYVKDSIGFKKLEISKAGESEMQNADKKSVDKSDQNPSTSDTIIVSHQSTSTSGIFSELKSSSINDRHQIKFLFRDNFYAIEVFQSGSRKLLQNHFGNKWTPLYLSMAEDIVQIGEKAKIDYEMFPKHVIYDVLKVIGKPLNEIKVDPKWGFKLIENNGIVYFQIETISDPRLFPQEIVIAAFLKTMKLQTESILNVQIKETHLSTNFKLTESQKVIFQKAAAKNFLEILSFDFLNV